MSAVASSAGQQYDWPQMFTPDEWTKMVDKSELSSVSMWVAELKAGNPQAAQEIWERYHARLLLYCRVKLRSTSKRMADEEDVAISTFESFFRSAQEGRFPQLDDRDDLWKILTMVASRKIINQQKHNQRAVRGGGNVRGDSVWGGGPSGWEQIASEEPSPELAARLIEEYRNLLHRLDDDSLQTVLVLKLAGFTNQEIAAQINRTTRSVELKLQRIRDICKPLVQ